MDDTIPPLPAGASLAETPPLPQGAKMGEAPPAPKKEAPLKEKKPTLGERAKDVFGSTVTGGVIGTFMPEIVTGAGLAAGAFPATAPAAPFLLGTGARMRGARLAQTGLGALSGFGEETAGQISEAAGQSRAAQEAWRLAGGALTPELANVVKYSASKLAGATGLATKGDIQGLVSAMAKDMGIDEKQLSPSQRKYIESVAERIRGGAKSEEFAKTVYSALEKGAEQTVDKYNAQARMLEQQAKDLVDAAAASATGRTVQAQQRVSALQSQFETSSKNLTDAARQRADNIMRNAETKAQQMRANVSQQTQSVRQIQEVDVQDMLKKARVEADGILSDARNRVTRLRDVATKARTTGAGKVETAKQTISAVGQPQTPTQTGTSIRDAVTPIFENLKKIRSDNAEKLKGEAFSFAAMKEAKGVMPKDTQAFKTGMAELDKLISDTTLSDIKAPLQRIRNALDPIQEVEGVIVGKPAKFESLEQVRRFLRDRSYGLPAEGYDAINQIQAGRLADMVENIQKEFSPGITKFLDQYRKDSEPLRVFKTKLGEALVGKEEFDMARFATDPAALGSKFFKSETGIKDLVTLLGGDASKAESIARGYVVDQLRTADSKAIQRKITEWRDWLPQFPALESQLKSAVDRLAQAERIGGRREKVSDVLRAEARALPETAGRTAARIEADAERRAAQLEAQGQREEANAIRQQAAEEKRLLTGAEREAGGVVGGAESQRETSARAVERQKGRIETEAERAGKAEVSEAERLAAKLRTQAGKLSAEGEQVRQQILGKSFDSRRVEEIIRSGDKTLWKEIGPLIAQDPAAKDAFGKALRQILADRATMSPRTISDIFGKDIRPALESTGLVSQREIANIQAEIDRINQTVEGPQKIALVQRLITNALVGEAARGLSFITQPFDTIKALTGKK